MKRLLIGFALCLSLGAKVLQVVPLADAEWQQLQGLREQVNIAQKAVDQARERLCLAEAGIGKAHGATPANACLDISVSNGIEWSFTEDYKHLIKEEIPIWWYDVNSIPGPLHSVVTK